MLTSQNRQRNKSSKRLRMRSPFVLKNKISFEDKNSQKNSISGTGNSTAQSYESLTKNPLKSNRSSNPQPGVSKSWPSTQGFKNKIVVSSQQFNRIKQQIQSTRKNIGKNISKAQGKGNEKKLKIKIMGSLEKNISDEYDKTPTVDNSNGSLESQQIQMLKVENQHFRKIYDQALSQLCKLKKELKEEKKVHDVEKQIYQNQINKLKRIVDFQKQEVSHIIFDEDNRCMIVCSKMDLNCPEQCCSLGLESDVEDGEEESFSTLSIESK